MNADKPARANRGESIVRGMLALVLLAAVVWALTANGSVPQGAEPPSSLTGQ